MTTPLDLGDSAPLVPPLFQSSVYTLPDLDALDRIMNAERPGFIYARDAHPNAKHLAARLAEFEAAEWAIVNGSGMAALSAILLACLEKGQRVLASNNLYGRTTQLLAQELPRFGIEAAFVDTGDLAQVEQALTLPTRLVLVETLSNPLLRACDLAALARLAHDRGALLVVENTFATPVLTRPLELGADLVMESLTKMIGGHSDITLGLVAGRGERFMELTATSSIWGFSASPFECWVAQRGLDTLALRTHAACDNALSVARWLRGRPGVARGVIYPGLEEHPDHELAGRLLGGKFGHMLCFDLEGGRELVNRFMRSAPGVPFSPSLGHTTTTCSHPWTTSHRYTSPAEKLRLGITEGLIRLSVGVEPFDVIQGEMSKGLK